MSKEFYIYGRKPIIEILQNKPSNLIRIYIREQSTGREIELIKELAREKKVLISGTNEGQIKKFLADEVNHQGVVALSKPFEYTNLDTWLSEIDMDTRPSVIVLDHLTDVSNVGAIIRSATAAGISAIIVAELNQAPITSAVYKTSAGTVGRIPVIQVGNINQTMDKLKTAGFWSVGLAMSEPSEENPYSGSTDLWQYDFTDAPNAIVVGSEGEGIRFKTREHCDALIHIPMENNVESLNASVSVAVVCYEMMRQKLGK
jgi:23S rRNA (guanosine2251-2'-O)-methyltransferase